MAGMAGDGSFHVPSDPSESQNEIDPIRCRTLCIGHVSTIAVTTACFHWRWPIVFALVPAKWVANFVHG